MIFCCLELRLEPPDLSSVQHLLKVLHICNMMILNYLTLFVLICCCSVQCAKIDSQSNYPDDVLLFCSRVIDKSIPNVINEQPVQQSSPAEPLSSAIAMKLTREQDPISLTKQSNNDSSTSGQLDSPNGVQQVNDQLVKPQTDSLAKQTDGSSSVEQNREATDKTPNSVDKVAAKSEEMTIPTSFDSSEESTEINDQSMNLPNNNRSSFSQARGSDDIEQTMVTTTVDSVANLVRNGNPTSRSNELRARAINQDLFGSFGSTFFNKLGAGGIGSKSNDRQGSLSLVDDEKQISTSFKQSEASKGEQQQDNSPAETSSSDSSNRNDKAIQSSSTTTTTTQKPATSTLSPEELEQQKIFEEFFDSRNTQNSNMRALLNAIKYKLGLGGSKAIPADELKQKLQSEIDSIRANIPTPLPIAPVQPAAVQQSAPVAPVQYSTPLPVLSTADYSQSGSLIGKSPKYLSYDEVKKQLDLEASKAKIESTYLTSDNKKTENYVEEIKKPVDDYTTIDKLKGQVNGPVEIPALDVKLQTKPKAKLDYIEHEKPEFRTDYLRLGQLNPFNRVPALSRYSKVVSSVSKGLSSLVPSTTYAKPSNYAPQGYNRI